MSKKGRKSRGHHKIGGKEMIKQLNFKCLLNLDFNLTPNRRNDQRIC